MKLTKEKIKNYFSKIQWVRNFKFLLRLLLAIVAAPVVIPMFWVIFSFLGVIIVLAIMQILYGIFVELLANKSEYRNIKEGFTIIASILIAPFVAIFLYVKGDSLSDLFS